MSRMRLAAAIAFVGSSTNACGLFFSHDDFDTAKTSAPFTIRGTVDGLEAPDQRVGVAINGGAIHEIANGPFEITTTLRFGERYAIESRTTPTGVGCIIEGGTGERKNEQNNRDDDVVVHCGGNDSTLRSISISNAEPFTFEPLRLTYSIQSTLPKLFSNASQTLTVIANQPTARLALINDEANNSSDNALLTLGSGVPTPLTDLDAPSTTKIIRVSPVVGPARDYRITIQRGWSRQLDSLDEPELMFGKSIASSTAGGLVAIRALDPIRPNDNIFIYEGGDNPQTPPRRKKVSLPVAPTISSTTAIAMTEDTLIAGATDIVGQPDNVRRGFVHVFRRSSSSGEWLHDDILEPIAGLAAALYGNALAIQGNVLLIGSPKTVGTVADPDPPNAFVDVFRREGPSSPWRRDVQLQPQDGSLHHSFGGAVGLVGDTAVVASRDTVYVFDRRSQTDGKWEQTTKLTSPQARVYGRFGASIAFENDLLVVGEPSDDPLEPSVLWQPGTAYVYRRDPVSRTFTEIGRIQAPASALQRDAFGKSVALRGDCIAVGAGAYMSPASGYLFRRNAQTGIVSLIGSHRQDIESVPSAEVSVAIGHNALIVAVPPLRKAFVLY